MLNQRFPHKLRVWRYKKDENDLPVTDENGDPLKAVVVLEKVRMVDYSPTFSASGAYETEQVEWIEFGYRTQGKNTRETIDVHISDYKAALPIFTTFLMPGDLLEIVDYDRTYWAEVVKKHTFNLGSNIWFNEVKN